MTTEIHQRAMPFVPTTINMEARTVDSVLATDSPVFVRDMQYGVIQEVLRMDGIKLPRQIPLLDSHQRDTITKQIGSTRNLRIENGNLVGTNHFSNLQRGLDALQMVEEGHLTDGSVGYKIEQYETVEPNKTRTLNGTRYAADKVPLRVVTRWKIVENSLLPIGADPAAKVRKDIDMATKKEPVTEPTEEPVTTQVEPVTRAEPDRITPGDLAEERMRGAREERKRVETIKKLAEGAPIPADIVQRCIDDGSTIEQAQAIFYDCLLKARAATIPAAHIHERSTSRDALECGLLLRCGFTEDQLTTKQKGSKRYTPESIDQGDRYYREVSLVDACRAALQIDNRAIPHTRDECIRAAFSSMTLPAILGAIANKSMMAGYSQIPATWTAFTRANPNIPDFKTQTRAQFAATTTLTEVGSNGLIKSGSPQDAKETYNLKTYAENLIISRQAIINDDLGAFSSLPEQYGAAAARTIADVVYEHFMGNPVMTFDTNNFFYARTSKAGSNLTASNALTVAGAEAAFAKFMQQKDLRDQPINVMPAFVVVPPELFFTARAIFSSELLIATGLQSTSAREKAPAANAVRGLANVISDPRLSNSLFTNYSTTTWYIFADPAQCPSIEVGYLNGQTGPVLTQEDAGYEVDGKVWKITFDFGVRCIDPRGAAKCTA